MAETEGKKTEDFASEIPSGNLPPVPYRDMPEARPLRKIMGPGVIMVAVGIGSGEYILNPLIASQVGLVFLWAAVIAVLTQYFINTEIARYTLATGETAVTGFVRIWKPWAPIFIVMTVLPWAWPGWMTSAATMLTFTFGGNVTLFSIIGLVIIGLTLTLSPVVYQTVEKFEFFKVGAVVIFITIAVLFVIGAQPWADLPGATVEGFGRLPEGISTAVLLSAIVFAGGGGTLNLTMSNWIRDKGWGMGSHIPRLVSPITGEEEARPSTGYLFPQDEENLRRWKGWWRAARIENFWTFFVVGAASIIVFSVLAYSVLPVGEAEGQGDLEFIRVEGEILMDVVGPWFGTFFWLIGAVSLMFANFVIIDMVGRITSDILKINYLRDSTFWTENRLYFTIVWAEVAFGAIILLAGINQPLALLVISAVLNAIVMFIYSAMLIRLNRGSLPDAIKVRGFRLFALGWAVLLFGFFSIITIIDQARSLFGG